MATTQDLQALLDEYRQTWESYGEQLRLNLADILLYHLRAKGWTQKRLADAAGMSTPQLARIIHARENCTLATAGRLFHSLGVDRELAKFLATPPSDRQEAGPEVANIAQAHVTISFKEMRNGDQEIQALPKRFNAAVEASCEGGGGEGPKAPSKAHVA